MSIGCLTSHTQTETVINWLILSITTTIYSQNTIVFEKYLNLWFKCISLFSFSKITCDVLWIGDSLDIFVHYAPVKLYKFVILYVQLE